MLMYNAMTIFEVYTRGKKTVQDLFSRLATNIPIIIQNMYFYFFLFF